MCFFLPNFSTFTYSIISYAVMALFQNTWANDERLSLEVAINEAVSQSPLIAKKKSQVTETNWKSTEASSGYLPTLNLTSTYIPFHRYLYTDTQSGGTSLSIPQVFPSSNWILSTQIPVFDGFATHNRVQASRSLGRSLQNESNWAEFELRRQVELQYFEVIASKVLKQVADQNLSTLNDHLNEVKLQRKTGIATNFDVLRVEVQVGEAKLEAVNAEDQIETTRNALAELLGKEFESRPIDGDLKDLKCNSVDTQNLKVDRRLDIEALNERIESQRDLETAADRTFIPKLGITGQYQLYNNRNDQFFSSNDFRSAYQFGFILSWNLFEGFATISRSKQSTEQRFQSEKTLEVTELKAKQDLEFWKRKFHYYCTAVDARQTNLEKATESVRLAQEGRKVGSRTNTDLLDAESELFKAKAGLVKAQLGTIEAVIRLELASGNHLHSFY